MKDEYYTFKSNTKKVKLKYAISLADRLINYQDKSSIKADLSQIWKLTGLSKNEFDALFIKIKVLIFINIVEIQTLIVNVNQF